jgi:hypothetical protein
MVKQEPEKLTETQTLEDVEKLLLDVEKQLENLPIESTQALESLKRHKNTVESTIVTLDQQDSHKKNEIHELKTGISNLNEDLNKTLDEKELIQKKFKEISENISELLNLDSDIEFLKKTRGDLLSANTLKRLFKKDLNRISDLLDFSPTDRAALENDFKNADPYTWTEWFNSFGAPTFTAKSLSDLIFDRVSYLNKKILEKKIEQSNLGDYLKEIENKEKNQQEALDKKNVDLSNSTTVQSKISDLKEKAILLSEKIIDKIEKTPSLIEESKSQPIPMDKDEDKLEIKENFFDKSALIQDSPIILETPQENKQEDIIVKQPNKDPDKKTTLVKPIKDIMVEPLKHKHEQHEIEIIGVKFEIIDKALSEKFQHKESKRDEKSVTYQDKIESGGTLTLHRVEPTKEKEADKSRITYPKHEDSEAMVAEVMIALIKGTPNAKISSKNPATIERLLALKVPEKNLYIEIENKKILYADYKNPLTSTETEKLEIRIKI